MFILRCSQRLPCTLDLDPDDRDLRRWSLFLGLCELDLELCDLGLRRDQIYIDILVLCLSPQAYQALAQATRAEETDQPLSEREIEVLRLAQRGLPNPQIAQALHISAGTVRNHLSAIYRKLGVHSTRTMGSRRDARPLPAACGSP